MKNKNTSNTSNDLLLQNRFGPLNDIDMDDNNSGSPKHENIPPIVYGKTYHDEVIKLLTKFTIKNYSLKFMSIGIRLNLSTSAQFKSMNDAMDEKKIFFYTHDLPNSKPIKIVLKGLYSMDTDILKKHLIGSDVKCTEIKVMTLKNKRFSEQCNYLIYFEKGSIKMSDLKKVQFVNHIVVRWEHYRQNSNITQCQNCQLYGHGSRNCRLSPKCVKCGGDHITKLCNVNVDIDNKRLLKCVNCNGNHTANYSQCPCRLKYVQLKQNISTNHKHNHKFVKINQRIPTNNNESFPPLHTLEGHFKPNHQNKTSWSDHFKESTFNLPGNNTFSQSKDLFTPKELMSIYKELIYNIQRCRTKFEQLETLGELVMKYLQTDYVNKP